MVTIQPLQVYVNELKMSGLGSPHPWGEDLGGGLFVACRPPPRPSPRRVRVPLWYIVLNINKIQIIIGQSGLNSYEIGITCNAHAQAKHANLCAAKQLQTQHKV